MSTRTTKHLLLMCALATFVAAACGGKGSTLDAGSLTGSLPPALALTQGVGLATVSDGGSTLQANIGEPLAKPFSAPAGDQIQPGVLPQSLVH